MTDFPLFHEILKWHTNNIHGHGRQRTVDARGAGVIHEGAFRDNAPVKL